MLSNGAAVSNTDKAAGVLRALWKGVKRLPKPAFSNAAWWMISLYNWTSVAILSTSAFSVFIHRLEKALNTIGKNMDRLLAERKRVRMKQN